MVLCDQEGKLVESNNAFNKMVAENGFLKERIEGSFFELIGLSQHTKESLIKGEISSYKTEPSFFEDQRKEFEVKIAGVTGANGGHFFLISFFQDTTKEKSGESESQDIKKTIENFPDGVICVLNRDFRIKKISGQIISNAHFNSNPITGKSLKDLLSQDDFQSVKTSLNEAFNGEMVHCELKVSGNYYHLMAVPFNNVNGTVEEIFAIAFDITKLRKTEEALHQNAKLMEKIINSSMDLIFVKDRELRTILCNEPAAAIFAKNPSEIYGKTAVELGINLLNPENDSEKALQSYIKDDMDVLNGKMIHKYDEIIKINGEIHHFDTLKIPLRDDKSNVIGVLSISRDITERIMAEQVIRISQERYTRIFENAPVGVFHTSIDGHFIDANPTLAKMLGYDSVMELVDVVNKSNLVDVLFADKSKRGTFINLLLSSSNWEMVENDFLRKDGRKITVNLIMRSISLPDSERTFVEGFAEDITERKNAEMERVRLESQIQRSQKLNSLGILAGGIAHDFNNLLSCIFGFIDLAHKSESLFKIKGFLGQAMEAFNRARGLTRQLLTFAKGGAPVCKVADIAETLRKDVEFALCGSNVTTRFEMENEVLYCNYDEDQIGQVIDNIVINAKQAMPSGGTLKISAQKVFLKEGLYAGLKEGDYIKITFVDNGPGIPEDILPHIFDPFFTTKEKGEGLGLSMVYSIVNRHHGYIDVVSKPGKGTTFKLFLPASSEPKKDLVQVKNETEHKGQGLILVMDDDELLSMVLSELIQSMGYETVLAKNGKEALELFSLLHKSENSPLKAAILDLTIRGGMGGKEVVQEIRKTDQKLKIFASSGYSDDPVISDPSQYLFTDSITKPFTREEVSTLFEKHMIAN
jgi:PAS domain S-box-containing protein